MKFPADQQQLRILSDNELRIAVETANACRDQAEADTTLCALYSEIERRISCYPLDVETVFTLYELLYGGDELSAPPEKQLATLSHAVANIYHNRDRATFADVHRYIAFLFMALLYVPDKKAEIEYEISHIFDTWMAAYIPGTGWPDTDSAETRRRSSTLLASEAYLSYPRYLSARTQIYLSKIS